jgi:hypothetical protein
LAAIDPIVITPVRAAVAAAIAEPIAPVVPAAARFS